MVFRVRVVVTVLSSCIYLVVVTAVPFYATTSWSQFCLHFSTSVVVTVVSFYLNRIVDTVLCSYLYLVVATVVPVNVNHVVVTAPVF